MKAKKCLIEDEWILQDMIQARKPRTKDWEKPSPYSGPNSWVTLLSPRYRTAAAFRPCQECLMWRTLVITTKHISFQKKNNQTYQTNYLLHSNIFVMNTTIIPNHKTDFLMAHSIMFLVYRHKPGPDVRHSNKHTRKNQHMSLSPEIEKQNL